MAQTRSIGRAGLNTFGWVVSLAGFQTTPAEEIDRDNPLNYEHEPETPTRKRGSPKKSPAPEEGHPAGKPEDQRVNAEQRATLAEYCVTHSLTRHQILDKLGPDRNDARFIEGWDLGSLTVGEAELIMVPF